MQMLHSSKYVVGFVEQFEQQDFVYLVTRYASEGDLFEFIQSRPSLSVEEREEQAKIIFEQLAVGVHDMHAQCIVHRDIKPLNIFIRHGSDGRLVCKIGDFGLACRLGEDEYIKEKVGTVCFMAPEALNGKFYRDRVDIWGLGIILYFLVTESLPFKDANL